VSVSSDDGTGDAEVGTVLIAEDNAASRRSLKAHLELIGYRLVGEAKNGVDAVELFKEHRPDLVVMDIVMPQMTGIEAAAHITAEASVPIILVTGSDIESMSGEAVESGIFGYLIKPVSKRQLKAAIQLALGRFEEFNAMKMEVEGLREAIESRKFIERAKGILMKRCAIDEADAFKMLQDHSQKENRKMRDIATIIIDADKLL
jgi:response regulator NasT